ncbi:MAG TPA: bifunctional alpha/beta hydrolase/OsmC family protein [Burkholderiales bacterium]|nr:bifunctional alpha/beta hydrolase/OsmC family protein [Burkholderiales bacterium]
MPSINVRFPATHGHALAARLELPAGEPRAYAIFAHCFTCSKDSKGAVYIGQALAARGIGVLRFDFTGLGQSGGTFAESTFSSNVEDIVCAANFLRERYAAPEILIGHSLGGAAILAAAGRIAEARAVATLGAPFEPSHVEHLLKNREELATKGEATVDIGGRPFQIRREFLDDLRRHDPAKNIAALGKALLVLHSPQDTVVTIDNASKIFLAAKHPKSFVSLDRIDHLVTKQDDAAYVGEVVAAWASRYLPPAPEQEPVPGVRVIEAGQGSKFAQEIYAGRHRLRADEPASAGGTDTGPNPYDLLAAALGACTAMTVRMYAERKQIPLARVSVDLKHGKVHAADCESCETREGKIDRIDRVVTLEGDLDDAQRAKLLEIADKCPVHRTLHSEVWINTTANQS